MLRRGVVGQCLSGRTAVDCTRGGRVHTPNTTTNKCVGDIVFRRVSFDSVVLFLHFISFVWCGAGVHEPHVEGGGQLRRRWFSSQPVSLGDWTQVFRLGSRCFAHWAISWAFLLYFTFLFYWFIHLFYIYGCLPVCLCLVPEEVRRGLHVSWSWSYKVGAGTELGSSVRAAVSSRLIVSLRQQEVTQIGFECLIVYLSLLGMWKYRPVHHTLFSFFLFCSLAVKCRALHSTTGRQPQLCY